MPLMQWLRHRIEGNSYNAQKKQCEKNACAKSGNIGGRTNYSQSNVATITKHQAYTMLGLGRQIVFMLKLLTASVMVLCVLCVMLIVKK